MIRIVALDSYDPSDLVHLCRALYQAFGLGTEYAGERKLSEGARRSDGRFDAEKLVRAAPAPMVLPDDKLLFLTGVELALTVGPLGEPQAWGFADYGGARAVLSTGRLPARGSSEASLENFRRRLSREAIHVVGHLWDLHHCYDARCAMHPSWSQGLGPSPEADLCNFCREKSEQRIRLAKT